MSAPKTVAPFPWFGGKSKVAATVWDALGDVDSYVEPFFGSGAVLLARPKSHKGRVETVNDFDGLLANFWRAVTYAPDDVAAHADWPVNECDLHARHIWLVNAKPDITARLMGDAAWFDAKAAGWWVWGLCSWIGGNWCSGEGPWVSIDGELVDGRTLDGNAGRGINRKLPHLDAGRGINRNLPHLGNAGQGINRKRADSIRQWFGDLSGRLRDVRVACGDWSRVTGPSILWPGSRSSGPICGVFLDPPYSHAVRSKLYADDHDVAQDVLAWCKENGSNPRLRIVLAGYVGEHDSLAQAGWRTLEWKAHAGYGNQGDNRGRENAHKERLWCSPHCLGAGTRDLFGTERAA